MTCIPGENLKKKEWAKNNIDKVKLANSKYHKNKISNDILYKLKHYLGNVIRGVIRKGKYVKKNKTIDILGCTYEDFRLYIEHQFESWMNWDNYGNVCETLEPNCSWDLDHILPVSLANTEEEVYLLNHWSNFQPLCSFKNRNIKRDDVLKLSNLELKITILEDKTIIKNE